MQELLVPFYKPRPVPSVSPPDLLDLVRSHVSPKDRRKRSSDTLENTCETNDMGVEEQKSAEERLKERLKAKFGGQQKDGADNGESPSKRPKISWP